MEEKMKSYLIKDIPSSCWRDFRIKLLQDGFGFLRSPIINF